MLTANLQHWVFTVKPSSFTCFPGDSWPMWPELPQDCQGEAAVQCGGKPSPTVIRKAIYRSLGNRLGLTCWAPGRLAWGLGRKAPLTVCSTHHSVNPLKQSLLSNHRSPQQDLLWLTALLCLGQLPRFYKHEKFQTPRKVEKQCHEHPKPTI